MEVFSEFLTDPTVDGKVQQLIGYLTQRPAGEIDNSFNFREIDAERVGYLEMMIATALTEFFQVPTEQSDIEPLSTVQDIVDRINNA